MYKVPEINDPFVTLIPPVNPPVTVGAAQLYIVPSGTIPLVILVGDIEKVFPLQILADRALTTAKGFTETMIVKTDPLQLPDTGVTV